MYVINWKKKKQNGHFIDKNPIYFASGRPDFIIL